jgi:hypothetical protein
MLGLAPRGRLTRRWQTVLGDHVIALRWSPAAPLLAAAEVSGPVHLLEAAGGSARQRLAGHGFGTTDLGWKGDGSLLASAGQDGKVRLWDPQSGGERQALAGGAAWVERLAWHPQDDLLASAAGRLLRLWNGQGQPLREYPAQPSTIADLAWRPGTRELTSAAYGVVAVWSPEATEPLKRFEWQGASLALAWSPDGKFLATGDQDSSVHYWIHQTGQDLRMSGYPVKVRELSWDATGRHLATGGGPVVTIWDCGGKGPEGTTPLQLEGHRRLVTTLAYQRDGPLLASGGGDGRLLLWQPGKYKKPLAESDLGSGVSQLAWSPDGRSLAVGCESGRVAVYGVS